LLDDLHSLEERDRKKQMERERRKKGREKFY